MVRVGEICGVLAYVIGDISVLMANELPKKYLKKATQSLELDIRLFWRPTYIISSVRKCKVRTILHILQ